MNDSLVVCGFERLRDLAGDDERVSQRETRSDACSMRLCESLASASSITQERDPLSDLVFEAVDVRDVRVVQRREDLRFTTETREAVRIVGDRREAGP